VELGAMLGSKSVVPAGHMLPGVADCGVWHAGVSQRRPRSSHSPTLPWARRGRRRRGMASVRLPAGWIHIVQG
jgi:hypothetical protein